MNNKTLGTAALLGAPAMLAGTLAEALSPQLFDSWFTGLWGLWYICGFLCIIIAIRRNSLLGKGGFAKALPYLLFVTLTMANIANLIWLFAAKNKPSFFMAIDLCWPLSHVLMLVVGIVVIRAKRLEGWQRFAPLVMGLWLPVGLGLMAVAGRTIPVLFAGGLFNLVAVAMVAVVVRQLPEPPAKTGGRRALQPVLQ